LAQAITAAGAVAGVAINPGTTVEMVRPLIPFVGMVTIMSVNPGFSGQKFLEPSLERIAAVRTMIREAGREGQVLIQVDGGVDATTVGRVVAHGASVLVAGQGVYGASDRARAVADLKRAGRA
jgi:ribulose-phosphate 3-epimerase